MFSYWLHFFSVESTIRSALPDNVSGGEHEIEVGGPLLEPPTWYVCGVTYGTNSKAEDAASLPFQRYKTLII